MTLAEAQQHCNAWTGDFAVVCGDWARARAQPADRRVLGRSSRPGPPLLRCAIERTTRRHLDRVGGDDHRPRLHHEERRRRPEPASVIRGRGLDDDDARRRRTASSSSIHVDPANGNRAWISYSGYSVEHAGHAGSCVRGGLQPGHRHVDLDRSLARLRRPPGQRLVRDDVTGDLYAGSDFGVLAPRRRHDDVDERRAGACRTSRSRASTIASGTADPLRRHARAQHMAAEPQLDPHP